MPRRRRRHTTRAPLTRADRSRTRKGLPPIFVCEACLEGACPDRAKAERAAQRWLADEWQMRTLWLQATWYGINVSHLYAMLRVRATSRRRSL